MAEYTQEQLDLMLADARKGLFTEDDLTRRVTSEVDRRIESGIQKGLDTHKSKWENEFAEKAKLTAEELAKIQVETQLKEIADKEKVIAKRANLLDAKELLSGADIPKDHYDNLMGMMVTEDAETTKTNVTNFINLFTNTKSELETKLKSELANIPKPNTGNGDGVVTKDKFAKMSYGERVAFKSSNPEQYKEYIR